MAFRVMVRTNGDRGFVGNGLVFSTEEEAKAYGLDLFSRWMAVDEYITQHTKDKPNYTYLEGRLEKIEFLALE